MELVNKFFQKVADTHNAAVSALETNLKLSNLSAVFIVIIIEMILLNLIIGVFL